MKTTFAVAALAASLWLSSAVSPHAQTGTPEFDPLGEHDDLPKQVRVQVEFINVPHESLTELLFGEKPPANDVEMRQRVAELIKEGKASVLETMVCTARSGQKATSESIQEFIYPTEYDSAELPEKVEVDGKASGGASLQGRRDLAVGPTPNAFDTRNIGSTLEIEPTIGVDSRIIDLRFLPEIVYHVGNEVWAEWKGQQGNAHVQMPKFYKLSLNTSLTLIAGQPVLAGALSPKDDEGKTDFTRKLMVFVRADVLTPGR
jgi:hypothetical protein